MTQLTAGPPSWTSPPQRPHPLRRLLDVLITVAYRVVWAPIRDGRLRIRGAPAGLGLVAVVAAGCFALALLMTAAAPWLRARLAITVADIGISAPDKIIWVVVAFVLLAVALLQVAGLHAPWWGRVGALLLSAVFLSAGGIQAGDAGTALRHAILAGGCWVGLVIISLIRRHRLFSWWEIVAVLALLTVPTVITAGGTLPRLYAQDSGAYVTYAWYLLLNVGVLATPIVVAAGFALASVAYSTIIWGVDLTRANTPPIAMVVALVLVAGWRLYAEIQHWIDTMLLSGGRIVAAVVMIIAGVVVWRGLDLVADRRSPGTTRPQHLGDDLQRILVPAAVIMSLGSIVRGLALAPSQFAGQVLTAIGAGEPGRAVIEGGQRLVAATRFVDGRMGVLVAAVIMLAWALRLARRGDRGAAELVGIVALLYACRPLFGYEPTTWYLPLVGTVAITVVGLGWAVRRRLTARRVEALLVLYLLLAAFSTRELFADPLALVLGVSAAVIFGLAWGFATGAPSDGGATHLPGRTLFFLGNSLLGAAVVAFIALASNPAGSIDPNQLILFGDQTLGSGLLLAALIAVGLGALRDDELTRPD